MKNGLHLVSILASVLMCIIQPEPVTVLMSCVILHGNVMAWHEIKKFFRQLPSEAQTKVTVKWTSYRLTQVNDTSRLKWLKLFIRVQLPSADYSKQMAEYEIQLQLSANQGAFT